MLDRDTEVGLADLKEKLSAIGAGSYVCGLWR